MYTLVVGCPNTSPGPTWAAGHTGSYTSRVAVGHTLTTTVFTLTAPTATPSYCAGTNMAIINKAVTAVTGTGSGDITFDAAGCGVSCGGTAGVCSATCYKFLITDNTYEHDITFNLRVYSKAGNTGTYYDSP